MSTQTGISTVAKYLSKELEMISICIRPQFSYISCSFFSSNSIRKLLTSTQKDTAETFLKSMMSSSDGMFDTNEVNTFTSTV